MRVGYPGGRKSLRVGYPVGRVCPEGVGYVHNACDGPTPTRTE